MSTRIGLNQQRLITHCQSNPQFPMEVVTKVAKIFDVLGLQFPFPDVEDTPISQLVSRAQAPFVGPAPAPAPAQAPAPAPAPAPAAAPLNHVLLDDKVKTPVQSDSEDIQIIASQLPPRKNASPVPLDRKLPTSDSDSDSSSSSEEETEESETRKDLWKSYQLLYTGKYRLAHSYNQRARPEGSMENDKAIERLTKLVEDREQLLMTEFKLDDKALYKKLKGMKQKKKDEMIRPIEVTTPTKKRKRDRSEAAPSTDDRRPKRKASEWISRDNVTLRKKYLDNGGSAEKFKQLSTLGLSTEQLTAILNL